MTTRISWLIAAALMLSCAGGCTTLMPREAGEGPGRSAAACVELLVQGRIEGSGWVSDREGHVVTAAHAVWGRAGPMEIVWRGYGRFPARVVALDRGNDLALLKMDGAPSNGPSLRVAATVPRAGSTVYLFGTPQFRHDLLLTGHIAGTNLTFNYYHHLKVPVGCYHVAAPSPPGTSGGPWLDEAGRVVGNQSGFINQGEASSGLAIVSPLEAVRRLVVTRASYTNVTMGCGLEELWSQAPGFIGRFPPGTEGLITVPVEEGGPAARAGMTKESLVLAANGARLSYREDLFRLLRARRPGDEITLTVADPDRPGSREVKVTLEGF